MTSQVVLPADITMRISKVSKQKSVRYVNFSVLIFIVLLKCIKSNEFINRENFLFNIFYFFDLQDRYLVTYIYLLATY